MVSSQSHVHLQANTEWPRSQRFQLEGSSGTKLNSSNTVLPFLLHKTAHMSFLNVTLHTASEGFDSSRIKFPVLISHSLTLPSLPPDRMNRSSNCNDVTELSWAQMRWRHLYVERSKMMTRPSDPPVTRISPESCNCPTSDVCPCSRAIHSLQDVQEYQFDSIGSSIPGMTHPVAADQTRTVESKLPVATFSPSNATS
jgi:hypothetical protein